MELSAVELVAIAGAVKDAQLTKAKAELADGSAHAVNFRVLFTGSVQKGHRSPAVAAIVVERDPDPVFLGTPRHFCELLKVLGIGPKRLREALGAIPSEVTADHSETIAIFEAEGARRAALLPKVLVSSGGSSGRAGAVQSQITAVKLDG